AANMRPLAGRIATAVFNRISFMDTQTWVRRIDDLLKGLDSLTRLKDGLILIGMTIIIWIPIIIGYWAGLKGVGIEATIPMAIFVMCAAAFSIAAPSSPGGIGVFHAGVTLALQVLGQPDGASAAFAFAYHFTNLLTLTVLGLIGLAATGATIRSVVNTTHDYLRRQKPKSPKS
ncbi:MAG: hypothetical protein GY796_34495, partial [Chloroflexi bacterium]|nr:hypothetical protein [Chloroflexota bacterium]